MFPRITEKLTFERGNNEILECIFLEFVSENGKRPS